MEEDAATGGFWSSYENGFTRWVERLQGNAAEGDDPIEPATSFFGVIWDWVLWILANILEAIYNILYAITHPGDWLAWVPFTNSAMPDPEVKISLARFMYYGGSVEFFFAIFTLFLIFTAIGIYHRPFMWGVVRVFEGIAYGIGRPIRYALSLIHISATTRPY